MENELENKIVKINVKKLAKSGINEIYISIKNLTNVKLTDYNYDTDVPIAWLISCLNDDDKKDVLTYLLKKANII